ncbi:MAG TPA: tetratricopeptide repeat protein [Acidobacteriota bacterium]|nr:tetratricopeptide repeat protein [Acidobacteriota bacterium]
MKNGAGRGRLALALLLWTGTFTLAAAATAPYQDAGLKRAFLRMLVTDSTGTVQTALKRLEAGEPFRQVARQLSSDVTAANGGYLGAMRLSQMNAAFRKAVEGLEPDSYSRPFRMGREHIILYRMPEGFRDRAIELSEEAEALLEEGRVEESIRLQREAVDINPEFIHGYFKLGVALGRAGRPQEEIEAYLKAVEIEPDYHQGYYNLGAALQGMGRLEAAISAFQRALKIDPNKVYCYVNLSGAYQALGQRQAAIEAARTAIDINPLLPAAHFNLGVAYGEQAPQLALEAFQMAETLDPGNPQFLHPQAVALAHLGRTQEARAILQDLLRQDPSSEAARRALQELDALAAQGAADRRAEAKSASEEGARSSDSRSSPGGAPEDAAESAPALPAPVQRRQADGPDSAEALAERARNALRQGDFQGALEFYDRAVRLKPTSQELQFQRAWTLVALGKVLQTQGQWENAWKSWERALQLYADFVPALAAMAHSSIIQGRFTLADEVLARARRSQPDNPEIAILASRLAYERRDLEKSFRLLQQIDISQLQGSQALKLLEQLLYLDLNDQALQVFRSLRLPQPQMLEAVNHLIKFSLFEEAERWLKANPSPYGQAVLGKLYSEQLRFDEAEEVLSDLAAREPQAWSAHYFLGQVYLNAGKADQAVETFQKALRLQPENVNVLLQLGQAAAQAGDHASAKEWLRQGLKLSPTSYQLLFQMGSLLLEEEQPQEAEPFLLKVLESEPDHIRTHYLLGRLYQTRGEAEKARGYLQRFQDLKRQLDEGRQRLLDKQNALKGRKLFP